MADYIFSKGTFLKREGFRNIVNQFKSAGWVDVSSNPTADFVVLNSKGESGDKDLFIQLRPFETVEATNSTETTDFNIITYRLIEKYTPGATGVSGTFERPTETWQKIHLVPLATVVNKDTELTYHAHVNKNRMIITIESPPTVNLNAITYYIGLPDVTYTTESGSKGLVVPSTFYPRTNGVIHVSNSADGTPNETTSTTRTIYCTLSPKNPNSAGLFTFSEMLYGSTTEGIRGKLSGLFALPNGGVNTGDIIKVGMKEFRIIVNQQTSTYTSFPTATFAIQIA